MKTKTNILLKAILFATALPMAGSAIASKKEESTFITLKKGKKHQHQVKPTPAPAPVEESCLPETQLLVPAYFWDQEQWDTLIASSKPTHVIFNPSSGPYAEDYQDIENGYSHYWFDPKIQAVKEKGHIVFGYVASDYTNIPISTVLEDAKAYIKYWGVKHFFIDETTTSKEGLAYYQELYDKLQEIAPGTNVILNPGILGDGLQDYYNIGPFVTIVTFESTVEKWKTRYQPDWHKYYKNRSYALVHDCTSTDIDALTAEAKTEGYLGLYCTERTFETNPWATMPTAWTQLVDASKKVCNTTVPENKSDDLTITNYEIKEHELKNFSKIKKQMNNKEKEKHKEKSRKSLNDKIYSR